MAGLVDKKPAAKCIFCGDGKLSREHFWPDWAYEYLPGNEYVEEKIVFTEKVKLVDRKVQQRQGGTRTKKIRVVCIPCNTQWMSVLEDKLKPILLPLMLGNTKGIPAAHQAALARWITLKLMVAEQNVPNNAIFTQLERDQFRKLILVPPYLKIWLANCGRGGWKAGFFKDSAITSLPDAKAIPETLSSPNIMAVTFGIGQLLVHAWVVKAPGVDIENLVTFSPAVSRIWPPAKPDIPWPPENRLSEQQAWFLASTMQRLIQREEVIWKTAEEYEALRSMT